MKKKYDVICVYVFLKQCLINDKNLHNYYLLWNVYLVAFKNRAQKWNNSSHMMANFSQTKMALFIIDDDCQGSFLDETTVLTWAIF